jgi:hypothetical protein
LLLCTRFLGVPSPSASMSPPSLAPRLAEAERSRLRPRLWLRARSAALEASMPSAPRLAFMASAVRPRALASLAGSTAWLRWLFFLERCSDTMT